MPDLPTRSALPAALAAAAALVVFSLSPGVAEAQTLDPRLEDAEIPSPGELRVRLAPSFQSWDARFGPDGEEERLASAFGGPLVDRIYPGPEAIRDRLNADAGALGFDSLTTGDVRLGTVDFAEVHADVRVVPLRLELGLVEGVALDLSLPIVRTEMERFFAYDSTGATLGTASAALLDPSGFLSAVDSARSQLENLLESGTLTASEEQEALALLDSSGKFREALARRVGGNALLPLGSSAAGSQLIAHWGGIQTGFSDFGVTLPSLSLAAGATAGDLAGYFSGGLLRTEGLAGTVTGWTPGELEAGARLRLHRGTLVGDGEGALRGRTAVGLRIRLAPWENGERFHDPDDPFAIPAGDGQTDVEITLSQDLILGGRFVLRLHGRRGFQLADVRETRVRATDRPFPLPSARRRVEWDPGDYWFIRAAPRAVLAGALEVGLEYEYWKKGRDAYRPVGPEGPDPAPLEAGTSAGRHRVGIGASYRLGAEEETRPVRRAPLVGFRLQWAQAGSGGRVPAAAVVTTYLEVPLRLW